MMALVFIGARKGGEMMRKCAKINHDLMDTIATYMDDDIRETVHFELAPCTPEEFLIRYIELDPDFETLLWSEFSIVMDNFEFVA